MADWNDWADGNDLAGLSRSTNPLTSAGYDPDEIRANPEMRAQIMKSIQTPYGLSALQPPGPKPAIGPPAPPAGASPRPMTSSTGAPAGSGTLMPARPPSVATPSPATGSAGVTATGSSQRNSELDAMSNEALQKGLELGGFAQKTAQDLAAGPDPRIAELEQERLKDQAPTPYQDASGRPLPQYRESGWGKVGRGLKAAALGFAEGGPLGAVVGAVDPGQVPGGTGYSAPNAAYQAAEGQREGRLANENAQISNLQDQFKAATDARKAALEGAKTGSGAYGDVAKEAQGMEIKPGDPRAVLDDSGQPTFATLQNGKWLDGSGKQIMNPKPIPPTPREAPQSVLINGKPGFALFDPQKGWLDPTPGPTFGQPLRGRISPVPTRAEAGGSGTGIPDAGDPTLTGDAYLASLPAELASTVRAIGEGREAPPSAGNRSKAAMAILNAVNRAYPSYDATQYPTYAAARKAFTSGPIGTAINAFNTALQHLDRMESNIPQENSRFETLNALENKLAPSGSKRGMDIGRFKTDANAVSNEVQKAYKGGVVNEDEYRQMLSLLDPNAAPAQVRSNLAELRQLLHGKLESYRAQWASQGPPGMRMPAPGIGGTEGAGTSGAASGGGGSNATFDWGAGFHPLPGGAH